MSNDEKITVRISEAALMLGNGLTPENVHGRIRRGTLEATKDELGEWRVSVAVIRRILDEVDPCSNCENSAVSLVIIKYHHHVREEFVLCVNCAQKAHSAYSRQGGVIEIVTFPFLGEGWKKP